MKKIADLKLFTEAEQQELEAKRNRPAQRTLPGPLDANVRKLAVSATFTAEPIKEYVEWWLRQFRETIVVEFAPYNQVFQELLDPSSLLAANPDLNLLLVRFEDWLRDETAAPELLPAKLEQNFTELVKAFRNRNHQATYLVALFPISGTFSWNPSVMAKLEELNTCWRQEITASSNAYLIDLHSVAYSYEIAEIYDPIKDRVGHLPFSDEYYAAMGTEITRKILSWKRRRFKVIVLDCDNTLWKGVCGEDGALGVKVEEPYAVFQRLLSQQRREGMLLTLCSKNNEADVWEVFEVNPGMILQQEDLVGWRINWRPKSENLKELAQELNLGLDSFIFIDDNPMECAEVMAACPEVLTLQLPEKPRWFSGYLNHVWAFDHLQVTAEDKLRTQMYQDEKKRRELQTESRGLQDFLQKLELKVSMNFMEPSQISRVSQLTERTNQFNLSTIRRTEAEIEALLEDSRIKVWVVDVADRFGAYGLVGVVITKEESSSLSLDTMLLSCRVLGKNVEETILNGLARYCQERKLQIITARYVPTAKNEPFLKFLERTGWERRAPVGETTADYVTYHLEIDKITEPMVGLQFYYQRPWPTQTGTEVIVAKTALIQAPSTTEPVYEPSSDNQFESWKVELVPGTGLLHQSYLLPLKYHTGQLLLKAAVKETEYVGAPETDPNRAEYVRPRNETEQRLATLWEDLFQIERIGIHDNFFKLGGHSLKATILISRLHQAFQVEVPLRQIFETPTIAGIAKYLEKETENLLQAPSTWIPPAPEQEYYPSGYYPSGCYPASAAQKRLYILHQIDPANLSYNLPNAIIVEGNLDRSRLEGTFQKLIKRHEAFRTSFEIINGEQVQRIHRNGHDRSVQDFQIEEWDDVVGYGRDRTLPGIIQEFIRPFDLKVAPLLRVGLIKIGAAKQLLLFDMHHIISDGTSFGILIKEFIELYDGKELPELRIQYKDFAVWQNEFLKGEALKQQEEYWLGCFQDEIPVLNLPTDYPRPTVQSFEGDRIRFDIGPSLTQKCNRLAAQTGTTLYMILLAAYNILLAKYTGQTDIIVGSPVAGRPHADLEQIIGVFINTLAMRNHPAADKTFQEFLAEVRENSLKAYENQDYQFEELVQALNLRRDLSHNPLFDVMFILQNTKRYQVESASLKFTPYYFENKTVQVDLTLNTFETDGKLLNTFEYSTKLFQRETIERFVDSFRLILQSVLENPRLTIAGIDVLTPAERSKILGDFNQTTLEYAEDKLIHELFEDQAARTPSQVALRFQDEVLTYRELDERANSLAGLLRSKGVKPNQTVGIMVNRSFEMIIGILGILKAGAAYLPIDPDYPEERIRYMLDDSQTKILLTREEKAAVTAGAVTAGSEVTIVALNNREVYQRSYSRLEGINTSSRDLAYLIYTSGSTGKPKGVMIEHRAVHNFIEGITARIEFTPDKSILALTTISFDIFGLETLLPLSKGLSIIIAAETAQLDPRLLRELIFKHQIQMLQITPSRLQLLLQDEYYQSCLINLTEIMIGGEALPESLLGQIRKLTGAKIYNMYGPTETTIWSTVKDLTTTAEVNIGTPIANTQIYIVDGHFKPVPIGVSGELCIAGDGLARGYLDRPELTAEKFVPNPLISVPDRAPVETFHETSLPPPPFMYRTGDLARWLPDGNIEFLGRMDYQVKIRGYRIELGEIEAQLLKHEAVKEAVVVAREDGGGPTLGNVTTVGGESAGVTGAKYLCAYLSAGRELSLQELRTYLSGVLPEYMVPSYFMQLPKLPLTPNGKINRKALPEPDGFINTGVEYVAPETNLEILIGDLWKEVLSLDKVGVHDKFFDLGGNSLSLVKLNALLNRKLGKEIALIFLFQYPTIRSLAQYLTQQENIEDFEKESLTKIDGAIQRMEQNLQILKEDQEKGESTGLEVAVIGMAGRFPGAATCREFWSNLTNGIESIRFFSDAELEAAGVEEKFQTHPKYVKAKGIIDQIEFFDANFFGLNPRDAGLLDPQIRIFYECVWEALEDAGCDPFTYPGLIGLYAGAATNYFWEATVLSSDTGGFSETYARAQLADKEFMTTRISYHLNLKGPSVFVATACSTSLVAVHQACRSLLNGECNMALAGGVSLALPQRSGYLYEEGMIMSPDGHCRAFDANAKGTVSGEGAGVVVLKMLKDAIRDGDHIYAVIKGTAINNDGSRKVGYTAPSIDGQVEVIRNAQRLARVEPESISYVEAHGTGTTLGDPMEIEALKKAFRTNKRQFCRIGSVKTNIGHLNTAAGIAGFIKTVLALWHKQLPPSLHYQIPNPKIEFENSPFLVNDRLTVWRRDSDSDPLRAGVSSFGIGGTNAHVVLEEAAPVSVGAIHESPLRESPRPPQLILLSAKTEAALSKIAGNLLQYLGSNPEAELGDVAYTLSTGRAHFPYRRMVVCADKNDAISQLSKQAAPLSTMNEISNLVWMFPGQGAKYLNMGRELYETEPVYREEFNRCCEILKPILNLDLKKVLYPGDFAWENSSTDNYPVNDNVLTQLISFSVEYALAKLLLKWGLKPQGIIGQGIGEYVGACLAEVFSLEDALSLVASYHSALLEPMPASFMENVSQIRLAAPKIQYLLNGAGNQITAAEATNPEYWAQSLRNTGRFNDGVHKLLAMGRVVLIEVGGDGSWASLVKEHPSYRPDDHCVLYSMRDPRDPKDEVSDVHQLLSMLGKLWLRGIQIDWSAFHSLKRRRRISLPTYPFERQRFWIDRNLKDFRGGGATKKTVGESESKQDLNQWFYIPSWKRADLSPNPPQNSSHDSAGLVFINDSGFSVRLVECLRQKGMKITIVKIGTCFQKENDFCYSIHPGKKEDYRNLLAELDKSNSGAIPRQIIHLWMLTGDTNGCDHELGFQEIENATDLGFYSLIHLAQAMGEMKITTEVLLKVITNNMQSVTGAEMLYPEKALVLGPVKIIPREYPNIKCGNIDIEIPTPDSSEENQLLNWLSAELDTGATDPIVAFRGDSRYVQGFEPIKLNQPETIPFRLRQNGVYLITGGLGGIGLVLARYLVETLQAKLILIGRSVLPARTDWEKWLVAHGPQDKVSEQIRKIKELEELGGEIFIAGADISEVEPVKQVLEEAEKRFGKINGVIHCAGLADGRMIQLRDRSATEPILAPKVRGTLVLDQLLGDCALDFFMFCSSINSVIPAIGQVGYCAANNFLDSYARYKNSRMRTRGNGTFAISINWDTWQEVGMAVKTAQIFGAEADAQGRLKNGIMPGEGIEIFKRILNGSSAQLPGLNQVVVSTIPLEERYHRQIKREPTEISAGMGKQSTQSRYPRPDLSNPYTAPRDKTEAGLAEIWQEVLGIEKVGVNDNFFELGGESLKALQIIEKAKLSHIDISVTDILTSQTISKIVSERADIGDSNSMDSTPQFANNQSETTAYYNPFYHLKDYQLFEVDQADQKVLQIKFQNEITTFLCHSLSLCVILADHKLVPWYYEHFINLFSVVDENGYLKLEFLEYRASYKEVLYEVYLGYQLLNAESNIISFLIDKINSGYYAIICVDEYYLSAKSRYQKEHFVHPSLVYGYDNTQQKLSAIGFNTDQIFGPITFDYEPFMIAYEEGKKYYQESAPWAENNAVELLKLKAYPQEYPFSLQKFLIQLDNYLGGTGDEAIIFTFMMDKQKVKYGIQIYDEIMTHLEDLRKGKFSINYLAIHLLWEHKKSLFTRLEYINKHHLAGNQALSIEEYCQIVAQVELIRKQFLQLSHRDTIDSAAFQNIVKEAVAALQWIKDKEQMILGDVSRQLHSVITG